MGAARRLCQGGRARPTIERMAIFGRQHQRSMILIRRGGEVCGWVSANASDSAPLPNLRTCPSCRSHYSRTIPSTCLRRVLLFLDARRGRYWLSVMTRLGPACCEHASHPFARECGRCRRCQHLVSIAISIPLWRSYFAGDSGSHQNRTMS